MDVDYNEPGDSVMSREIFTPGGLDYIFSRMLSLGINNWSRYFSIASHALTSGGFIEHQDLDWNIYGVGTSECLSDKWGWHQAVLSGAEQAGLSTHAGSDAAPIMKAAGLEIVSVQTFEYSNLPSSKTPNSQAVVRYVQAKLAPQYETYGAVCSYFLIRGKVSSKRWLGRIEGVYGIFFSHRGCVDDGYRARIFVKESCPVRKLTNSSDRA